ncbi:hypothetical protein SDC9_136643 [bioreactor metagenome]|uniref:Uncharacterized protein n=1 Tax=bioreactor metagenome TaxID=1076179 RepID=A0A645DJA5_9ZZZZ
MSIVELEGYVFTERLFRFYQPELSCLEDRFNVFLEKRSRFVKHRFSVIIPLRPTQPVSGPGKSRDNLLFPVKNRSSAAVIKMEVGKYNIGYFVRRIADFSDFCPQVFQIVRLVELQLVQLLVASPTIYQYFMSVGFNEEASHCHQAHVVVVAWIPFVPVFFGYGPKHGTAICPEITCLNYVEICHFRSTFVQK